MSFLASEKRNFVALQKKSQNEITWHQSGKRIKLAKTVLPGFVFLDFVTAQTN